MVDRRDFLKKTGAAGLGVAAMAAGFRKSFAGEYEMIIKDVKALVKGEFVKCDIGVTNGVVSKIDKTCSLNGSAETLDAKGLYASPGWVDLHVHAISVADRKIGASVDRLGEGFGVTAMLDAGTCGPANYNMMRELAIDRSPVDVFAMVNIKANGIRVRDMYRVKPGWEDFDLIEKALADNPNTIKGLKIRASAEDTVKKDPLYYMRKCREAGDLFKIPTMVHIGPPEPNLASLLPLMKEGDFITHAMRKPSHCIIKDGKLRDEVKEALNRGVTFDIGHGVGSFAFETAERALDLGFDDFTISTDLWVLPVYKYAKTMANVMTKFLAMGMSLEDVCYKSSTRAAEIIREERVIEEGKPGSLTLFSVQDGNFILDDTVNAKRKTSKRIIPEWTIHKGKKFRAGDLDRRMFI